MAYLTHIDFDFSFQNAIYRSVWLFKSLLVYEMQYINSWSWEALSLRQHVAGNKVNVIKKVEY